MNRNNKNLECSVPNYTFATELFHPQHLSQIFLDLCNSVTEYICHKVWDGLCFLNSVIIKIIISVANSVAELIFKKIQLIKFRPKFVTD